MLPRFKSIWKPSSNIDGTLFIRFRAEQARGFYYECRIKQKNRQRKREREREKECGREGDASVAIGSGRGETMIRVYTIPWVA
jgi:hypothetical protein